MTAPLAGSGHAIGIDLGTSNTVAILRWPDGRTRPLLVDGRPVLPSGVYVDSTGTIHAGRDAERMAQVDPGGYEPNPKQRIDDGAVLLAGREVPVADLLAAVLRAVAGAAGEAVGFLPPAVLTYPAAWGSLRRQTLQDAATRAGWPQVRLMPEPVAAARYFTDVMRRPVPAGGTIAVFDFGGGTLDVAMVRREATGFTVLGWGGAEDLGGLDIDAALVAYLGQQLERTESAAWQQISQPATELDRRHRRQFWDEVRSAKEMLSRATTASVAVPGVSGSLHVTRDELETLARPLVRRGVAELVATAERSRLTPADLSVVFLVGGASRIPLVSHTLHTELGVAPTMLEQPELPVAEGALADLIAQTAPQQPPPPRQPPVPAPTTGMFDTRTGIPTSGVPHQVPLQRPPMPVMPVSAHPAPAPISATPVSPVSPRPAPVMPPPPGFPYQRPMPMPMPPPPPRRRSGGKTALRVLLILTLVFGCLGGGVYTLWQVIKPKPTFQKLSQTASIQVEGMTETDFATAFLTEKKAHTVTQVGRAVDVATLDLSTSTIKRKKVGDAAKWSQALMIGDYIVALAEPENGKRQLVGVNNIDGTDWAGAVGTDGVLMTGDVHPTTGNAPPLLWLDRKTNQMSRISSVTGKVASGLGTTTIGLPAGWRLLDPANPSTPVNVVLVAAGGAVWDIGGKDPKKVADIPDTAPVGRVGFDGLVYASQQTEYQVKTVSAANSNPQPAFRGPANRSPVWISGCSKSSDLCVIDQIGTDESTREFARYRSGSAAEQVWRVPVPDADLRRPPQSLGGDYDDRYLIINTTKGGTVYDSRGTTVASHEGALVGIDTNRAFVFTGTLGTKPAPVTLRGLDLDNKLQTSLGTQTIRSSGCWWNSTSLICPGAKDYTVWRYAK
ncbi:Hsp70 family protein [Dactylosporangium cerinum]|uniref:Hsp70 family protein n=1 Tax=Dactylosporangium cerinum TaxID=1434730 RepID=A0ABV9WBB3_9ACTN